jgi:hypothetical protein
MRIAPALILIPALALAGCVTADMAESTAQDTAADQCAQQGKVFVQTAGSARSDGVVAGATAKGHCESPNGAADVPPPPPPPNSSGY